uniref:Rab_C91 protein n=1 Tax=Paramecium tetraurelia TaxID=5888 RepID=Q3SDU2_PARTE|nr:rab_C91 [Paramecium tetraurelia]
MKKRDLKLVLIGDSGVGKSSFVSALINQISNKALVLDKHQPINLPPDILNHPECITTLIDTKCAPHQLPQEIQIADVILLMYSIDDDGSSERLKRFWLKELREQGYKQPVIIVGNKLDLLGLEEDRDYHRIFKVIKQLVKDFNSVEMGIECSSIKQQGIYDVINCAQRSFLYPLAPIYSIAEKSLTEGFKKALTRIFRICDRDGDGVWSDAELEKFQKKVFKRQLDYSDITGIKDMIEEELHDNSNKKVITLEGFIALQKRGIELMKIQICWTILRFFRYKDDLTLDENIFTNELIFDQDAGQTVELSEIALSKLKQIFEIRCNSRFQQGNTLNQKQFDDIFYPVMYRTNFPHLSQYYPQEQNVITLTQWLAMWKYSNHDIQVPFPSLIIKKPTSCCVILELK